MRSFFLRGDYSSCSGEKKHLSQPRLKTTNNQSSFLTNLHAATPLQTSAQKTNGVRDAEELLNYMNHHHYQTQPPVKLEMKEEEDLRMKRVAPEIEVKM